jgi:hypothetical protein
MACGSSESNVSKGNGKSDGGSKTSAAAGGTQTCKITVMGDSDASEPFVLETEGSPTALIAVGEMNPVWAVLNSPKSNGIIGCFITSSTDAGATTHVQWEAELDQPGPLKPYMMSSDTAKLTSAGHTPLEISASGGGEDFTCGVTVPVCPSDGSECKSKVIGSFDFDVTYAKPAPLQPSTSMGWFVKATGHAECPGTKNGMISIDIGFDVK